MTVYLAIELVKRDDELAALRARYEGNTCCDCGNVQPDAPWHNTTRQRIDNTSGTTKENET